MTQEIFQSVPGLLPEKELTSNFFKKWNLCFFSFQNLFFTFMIAYFYDYYRILFWLKENRSHMGYTKFKKFLNCRDEAIIVLQREERRTYKGIQELIQVYQSEFSFVSQWGGPLLNLKNYRTQIDATTFQVKEGSILFVLKYMSSPYDVISQRPYTKI